MMLDIPEFEIHAPLLLRSKAQTWMLAEQLGILVKGPEDKPLIVQPRRVFQWTR